MPNPKRRHSKSRRDKRRANWKLTSVETGKCPQCKSDIFPHRACSVCGYYKGETVMIVKQKSKKTETEEKAS